jgi:hypothetical protein
VSDTGSAHWASSFFLAIVLSALLLLSSDHYIFSLRTSKKVRQT